MKTFVSALQCAVLVFPILAGTAFALDKVPDAYAEQVLGFAQRHCIEPMLESGAADPTALKRVRKHVRAREIYIDPSEPMPDAALTLTVFSPEGLAPVCSVHQTPGFWSEEIGKDAVLSLAEAGRARLSSYILEEFDASLARIVRDCHAEVLAAAAQDAPVAGAWLSADGSRSLLIVLQTGSTAEPGVAAVSLGPVADCGERQ